MPNGRDNEPVAYGRWQEAHRALEFRVAQCETEIDQLRSLHEADIEELNKARIADEQKRVNRRWQILLAILSAFLFPLLVAVIVLAAQSGLPR